MGFVIGSGFAGGNKVFNTVFLICLFTADPAVLQLNVVGPSGEPVTLTRARWVGQAHRAVFKDVELPTSGAQVSMVFSRKTLLAAYGAQPGFQMLRAHILLEAEGFVALMSYPIHWAGGAPQPDHANDHVVVWFPRHGQWILSAGEKRQVTLRMEKPKPHYLRFLDTLGRPVTSVPIRLSWQWQAEDLVPRDFVPFYTGKSNERGFVEFAGDEVPLMLEWQFPGYTQAGTRKGDGKPIYQYLGRSRDGFFPPVILREITHRSLEIRLTRNGQPAEAGIFLLGLMPHCRGACGGPIGTSNGQGVVVIDSFRPDTWAQISLGTPDGDTVWQADPVDLEPGPLVLDIGDAAVFSQPSP